MGLVDYGIIAVILAIVGIAGGYVYRSRKSGRKCIGCPNGCACSGKNGQCGCSRED